MVLGTRLQKSQQLSYVEITRLKQNVIQIEFINLYKLNNKANYLGWEEVPDKPNREAYDRDIYMPIQVANSTKTTREETIWDSLENNWGDGRWYSAAEFKCTISNYEGVHDD